MTSPADLQAPPSTAPVASTTSTWEDLIDIFYAPSKVFERRRLGRYGLALLVLAVLMVALYFAARPLMDAVMEAETARRTAQMIKDNPSLTEEQLAAGRKMGEKIAGFLPFLMPIGIVITVYLIGLGTWIVGKIVGAKQTFAAAVMVTVFSMYPSIFGGLAAAVQSMMSGGEGVTSRFDTSLSAARFLDASTTSDTMLKLASTLNPFVLWGAFLIALGMKITGNLTWQKAAIVAVVVTLVRGLLSGY